MMKYFPDYKDTTPAQDREEYLARGFNNFSAFCDMITEFREAEIEPRTMDEAREIITDLKNRYCDKAVEATFSKMIAGSYGIQTKTEYRRNSNGESGYHTSNFIPDYIEGAAKARNNLVAAVEQLKFKY